MANGPRYKVPFRRRREGKTNYHKRLKLLLSKKPRLVVRKTSRNTIIQLIVPTKKGDETLLSANTSQLKKYGYNGATGNTPAAYLTGLLFGYCALEKEYDEAVLDIGLHTSTKGSRIYAALKGVVDAGMQVPHDPVIFPSEERIRGEHIENFSEEQFENTYVAILKEFNGSVKDIEEE
ncbi:MAG: 50S ribosomal protein L18 [Methanosarcinales archaeon]